MASVIDTSRFQVGAEVYYTGDMANSEGFGRIVKVRPGDDCFAASVDVELDSDTEPRTFRQVFLAAFSTGPGQRFWFRDDWEADRKARYEQSMTRMLDAMATTQRGGLGAGPAGLTA